MSPLFLEIFLTFIMGFGPLILWQLILMFWIITYITSDSIELDWFADLKSGLHSVALALKIEKSWVLVWLIATLVAELLGIYDEEAPLLLISFAMLMPIELVFLRIQWQVIKQHLAKEGSLTEEFQNYTEILWRLFFVNLIIGIMEAAAFPFFILPAVILGVYVNLALVISCFRGKGIFSSIKESFELINGVFIKVCNYLLPATLLLGALPSIVLSACSFNVMETTNISLKVPFSVFSDVYFLSVFSNISLVAWQLLTLPLSVRLYIYLSKLRKETN